ncbi:MAG: NAD(P)-dependent oxidoreductase [Chthoniobacteraceae bacterium]
MTRIETVAQLEESLSTPTDGLIESLRAIDGDILVLGAGGKMGPTLARMARRAKRRVIAVSRFSSQAAADELRRDGVETIACDLLDRDAVARLPDAPNVIFMAGQKFGTADSPELTWVMNTVLPAIVAERYAKSRIVVFSTACVYPLAPVAGPGSREGDPLGPPGEYANSCVGRERVFEHFSKLHGTPALLYRLSYAVDLRYGVLHDVARKVAGGESVDVSMGFANVIWQGDANARAIQCLAHTNTPPVPLNVSGPRIAIRELAHRFGELFGHAPAIIGEESPTAWVVDPARSFELFGPLTVSLDEMIEATAHWVRLGGATLGKPTHFDTRDGRF